MSGLFSFPELGMLVIPKEASVRRYGLSLKEWREILKRQGRRCAICQKLPPSGKLVVDHEHVKNWRYRKPAKRKAYVRGLVCAHCNRWCLGKNKPETVMRMLYYFAEYHRRSRHLVQLAVEDAEVTAVPEAEAVAAVGSGESHLADAPVSDHLHQHSIPLDGPTAVVGVDEAND